MQNPKFAIAVHFKIKKDHVDAFRDRVIQQARDSVRLEPGCCQFDVLADESDPSMIFLYETYDDAAAFDDHKMTDHFADFNRVIADWVESKQVQRLNMLENNHDL